VLHTFQRITPLIVLLTAWCVGGMAQAAKPSEEFLPTTTKSFICVPDMALLRTRFEATQLGELARDPVMKPFLEDMEDQIRIKLNRQNGTLNLSWEDLEQIATGEVILATVQPWNAAASDAAIARAVADAEMAAKKQGLRGVELEAAVNLASQVAVEEQNKERRASHASIFLVDVTGRLAETRELLKKVDAEFLKRQATRSAVTVLGQKFDLYTLPKTSKAKSFNKTYVTVVGNYLFACDHPEVTEQVLRQMTQPTANSLAAVPAFRTAMDRCRAGFADVSQPHVRWFIEPFGYAEVARATSLAPQKRKRDLVKILSNQGFKAIQGLGGWVMLRTDNCEVVHRTFIYAPPVPDATDGNRYRLAANMLDFPNGGTLEPLPWIPRNLAYHMTFNWRTQKAFYASETLVNEYASDNVFDEMLKSLKLDSNGPRVDIESELIAYLGDRATVISDYKMPINPKSERMIVAVEVTNTKKVAETVNKVMEADQTAKRLSFQGHTIWEIVNQDDAPVDKVQVTGNFGFEETKPEAEVVEEDHKHHIPNSAVTVAHNHLIVATHVDCLRDVLVSVEAKNRLSEAAEYQQVQGMLRRLNPGTASFRIFTRTDEAVRVTYELFRQGKMPESESMFGRLLNRALEPDDKAAQRKAEWRGDKLPEFQIVRRYLGPAGLTVQTDADGWSVTGGLLRK
jgi:hypothetical protein